MTNQITQVISLENLISNLFFDIASDLSGTYVSVEFLKDDNFNHRRDRISNDIHAFFELYNKGYFHLRSYTRHMMDNHDMVESGNIFLTGYRKDKVELFGGAHSLRQDWYINDSKLISFEIISQNPDLFKAKDSFVGFI